MSSVQFFFVTDGACQQASLREAAAWVKFGAGGSKQVSQVDVCYASLTMKCHITYPSYAHNIPNNFQKYVKQE
ncbi:hypothetical protein RHGRI_026456 [Rhododendron griersonianum]|uniref:Uncharacterized protein n=1 Tax=Rhododendron griersonianum TaxID=479676 RepID=A0AAV6IT35_9ERIC|nr:hypothetical protein RHGRI_026456 [Rhododendron griersonianum]